MLKDRLTQLRKANKKTQQDMAPILGITRPAYTAYERGTRNPDYDTLRKIAEYFDVTTDYLLGLTDDPNTQSLPAADNEEEKIFFSGGYESLTAEEKEHLEEELQRFRKMKKRWEELYRKGDKEE
ncbi:helix-turn-helix transcriptional regulator [Salicibibacter cibarius]|uniref:XRE family transcriptional regulator n=2 Tax=Salicibibacter TaxID=2685905 RepID=A0A514LJH4_9BACI|nr:MULTISPECIES: helix-turn-helix transcriptional regulator [Salicibibacter]QDI92004.1 XRE family transcriptional regulator [Salicibibacter halophilus]QQK74539.1 helix-turn-helix transcriptional regulator [Salicibibacter cibarius]